MEDGRQYTYGPLQIPSGSLWTDQRPSFQALIKDVLRDFFNVFAFVYIDDILIFSPHPEETPSSCPTSSTKAHGEQALRQRNANFTATPPSSLGSSYHHQVVAWTQLK